MENGGTPDSETPMELSDLNPEAQKMVKDMQDMIAAAGDHDEDEPPADTPLSHALAAAEAGNLAELTRLMDEHGLQVDEQGDDGDTALHLACLYGHLAIVQECVRRGANVMACDEDGSTPLHDASAGGYYDIAKLLLERGAQVDVADSDGDTPLHNASNGNHRHVCELLLSSAGAERAAKMKGLPNGEGHTPADLAEDPALVFSLRLGDQMGEGDVGNQYKKSRG